MLFRFNINTNNTNNKFSTIKETCSNGCPSDTYTPDLNTSPLVLTKSADALYSIYNSYQKTFTPKYLLNNHNFLTEKTNFSTSPPGPANIFIIRHGEKPEDGYTLNCNGVNRACQLPDFINNLGENGFPIFAIVTCLPDMTGGSTSSRHQFTVMMSSFLLNIPIFMYQKLNVSQSYDGTTALQLFTDSTFIGKNVLICWSHKNIQALTNQIVQCQNYLASGKTISQLKNNSSTVFSGQSTKDWWTKNTPIPLQYQYDYSKLSAPANIVPAKTMPYTNYAYLLPYWNTNNFNLVYKLSHINNDLSFSVFNQNITTCFQSCCLLLGLIQHDNSEDYVNEDNCGLPI